MEFQIITNTTNFQFEIRHLKLVFIGTYSLTKGQDCGPERTRTAYLPSASGVFYQVNYGPARLAKKLRGWSFIYFRACEKNKLSYLLSFVRLFHSTKSAVWG